MRLWRWIMGWYYTWRIMRNKELMASIKRAQKDVEEGRFVGVVFALHRHRTL